MVAALNLSTSSRFLSTPSARRATTTSRMVARAWSFLSTPSARRATALNWQTEAKEAISIHALREEGDLHLGQVPHLRHLISIHALREEGDVQVIRHRQ